MVKLKYFLGLALLLSACTSDHVPDEDFEAPTSNFPLLGSVPDRPLFPESKIIEQQKSHLKRECLEASQEAEALTKTKTSTPH